MSLGVTQAGELMNMKRSSVYEAIKKGDIETVEINGRMWVKTLPLLRKLGLLTEGDAA